jgi:hypothetical protein
LAVAVRAVGALGSVQPLMPSRVMAPVPPVSSQLLSRVAVVPAPFQETEKRP